MHQATWVSKGLHQVSMKPDRVSRLFITSVSIAVVSVVTALVLSFLLGTWWGEYKSADYFAGTCLEREKTHEMDDKDVPKT